MARGGRGEGEGGGCCTKGGASEGGGGGNVDSMEVSICGTAAGGGNQSCGSGERGQTFWPRALLSLRRLPEKPSSEHIRKRAHKCQDAKSGKSKHTDAMHQNPGGHGVREGDIPGQARAPRRGSKRNESRSRAPRPRFVRVV